MNSQKVVLVIGNFNVLHPGHLRLFRFARECGDRLIVAVNSDKKAGFAAHVLDSLRLEGVKSNQWVDEAFISDESDVEIIKKIKPDIVVKGKEHEASYNPELTILQEYGGRLLFNSGETTFSSLDLIRKEFLEFDSRSIKLPLEYMARHQIDVHRIKDLINNFSNLNVCVIGDLIVDEYITCQPLGMSQEDTTIVVMPVDAAKFIGGAGIVAAHALGMGANVQFISVTGADGTREFSVNHLREIGLSCCLLVDDSRPTTLKQRYRSKGKTLLRVSHLHQGAISIDLQEKMLEELEKIIDDINVLVFSDFNYGCLPQSLVDKIILMARKKNLILAADSQSSSQIGNIARFQGMDLLTPTEREARISMRNHEDGLVVLTEQLRQQANAKNILLKLAEEGMLIYAGDDIKSGWHTDRVNALNSSPKDVAGAGDSLLIASAMTLASGGSIWEAACVGSLAAAVQVGRVGNTPIQRSELMQEVM